MKIIQLHIFLLCFVSFGQNKQIDSLISVTTSSKNAYEIASTNLNLAKIHERIDLKKGKNYALKAYNYKKNDSLLAETNYQLGRFEFYASNLDSATVYFQKTKALLKKLNNENRLAIVNISLGAVQLRQGNYTKTIETLTKSAKYFEDTDDSLNAAKCYSNIASAFAELELYPKAIDYSEKALQVFENLNQTQFKLITLPNLATQYFKNGDTLKAIENNTKAEQLATRFGDKRSLSIIYNNLGELYLNKDPQKAKQYLKKTIALKEKLNLKSGIHVTQSNLGYVHLKEKDYEKAIYYFEKALKGIKGKQLVLVYKNLSKAYKGSGNMSIALEYSEKSNRLNNNILNSENQKNLLEIQTEYETEKKEKEILKLKTENLEVDYRRKQNRNLLFITLAVLLLTIFLIYTIQKNTKRKRIIMEQNLKIKEQDFNQLLKSQELEGIDEIIDAQERERSKIAADLHDSLGSKVATLKLILDSYDDQDEFSEYYNKLKDLISEIYNNIRNISKNKTFVAEISKGLMTSTIAIARQISNTKKVDIQVQNIDVNIRIENTLEIQIFRIIQELITNIIKHSQASEATIQFSQHEGLLTIMVEDNGKGFDLNDSSNGIGLINIERRMERINGELVIDSSLGNGTTVILNIPL